MSAERRCPKCGTALLDEALGGLCRKCLGSLGFGLPGSGDAGAVAAGSKPNRFGDYELLGEIARGGMGVVYKARQLSLNRTVAVKMVLHGPFSSDEFVRRFHTEAEAVAGLEHPNIVAIYEIGQHDGHNYFSMEYIEGQDLGALVREKPLAARRAARYLKSISEAVQYAHEKGVLHRDLKPSNLLLDIFDQPRITDFGLAKLVNTDSQLTVTGQALGSPGYMAPEQATGKRSETSPQSDIYSLGAILYHLLTGRPPFQGETLQDVLLQAQNSDPIAPRRLNSSVPKDLQTICLKCLQKEPAKRYGTAGELAEDLGHFLASEPIQARPASASEKARLWCRRRPVIAGLSLSLTVAVLLGVAGIFREWRQAEQHAEGELMQRRRAEEIGGEAKLKLYAADVNLASQAIKRGDYGLAAHILSALRPVAGQEDLRGFEWRYLWNLCQGQQLATLKGHKWIVTTAAFSPDGKTIATGSQDGTVKIWDVASRKLVATLPANGAAVWCVGFSPEGKLLMMAGHNCKVQFRDTGTWQLVRTLPGRIAAISKTGPLVATSDSSPFYWERVGKVVVWNYQTGEKLKEIKQVGRALVFSADGRTLALAGPTNNATLWDVASGKLLRTLATAKPVWSLAFSPDGTRLATAGWSSDALIWGLGSKLPPQRLKGHQRTVWSAAYSPDGSTIVTTASDQTVRLWDALTLRPKSVLHGHGGEVWCGEFSPDGKMLVTGGKDQLVKLWTVESAGVADEISHEKIVRPVFSPDGKEIAVLGSAGTGWRPQLWDADRRTLLAELAGEYVIGFSPDGKPVIRLNQAEAALELQSGKTSATKVIKLGGVEPGQISFEFEGFSGSREIFFATDRDGVVRLWDAASGKLLHSIHGPAPPIRTVALSPGGKYLAISVERENSVALYETEGGRERQLAGHRDFVSGLAFSADGFLLATASMDGTIKLWDTAKGIEKNSLPGHSEEATDVAFSPDGRTLASLGHQDSVKFWHVATGRELLSLEFPQAGYFLQFSPDGRHLAVTTEDNTVHFFDAPTLGEFDQPVLRNGLAHSSTNASQIVMH